MCVIMIYKECEKEMVAYLNDPQQQTCKVCGKKDKINFNVPDEIWASIVPPIFQTKVVCLACFDAFALEKNINYANAIDTLYFAGDKANLIFTIQSAMDLQKIIK